MAEPFVALGLQTIPMAVDNYHKAWHPIKNGAKKVPRPFKKNQKDNGRSNGRAAAAGAAGGAAVGAAEGERNSRGDHNGDRNGRDRGYSSDDQDSQSDRGYDSYDAPPRRREPDRPRDRPRERPRQRAAEYDDFSDSPPRRRETDRPRPREAYWEGDKYVTKEWDEDSYFTNDGRRVVTRELVVRKKGPVDPDRNDSIANIQRKFPPPQRPGMPRRTTSLDREDTLYHSRRGEGRRRDVRRYDDDSASESDLPPRRNRRKSTAGSDTRSQRTTRSRRRRSSSRDTKKRRDPSSDSEVSSSEEERKVKSLRNKELLTAGFAAVATINASSKIYKSLQARDKRHQQVLDGELSPEEARKLRNKARTQDLAAVGLAALGIKGAIGKWKAVEEHRGMVKETKEIKERHHQKREEKRSGVRSKSTYGGGRRDRNSSRRSDSESRERRENADRENGA